MGGFIDSQTTATYLTGVANGGSLPVAMPATVNSGDYLFALFAVHGPAISTPSGWTHPSGPNPVYFKQANGTEGGTTVNWIAASGTTSDYPIHVIVARYRFDAPVALSGPTPIISQSDQFNVGAFVDQDFTHNYPVTTPSFYEERIYVVNSTAFIGSPVLTGYAVPSHVWTSMRERVTDERTTGLGPGTIAVDWAETLTVADQVLIPGQTGFTSSITLGWHPNGGQAQGTRVRVSFDTPPEVSVGYWGINATPI